MRIVRRIVTWPPSGDFAVTTSVSLRPWAAALGRSLRVRVPALSVRRRNTRLLPGPRSVTTTRTDLFTVSRTVRPCRSRRRVTRWATLTFTDGLSPRWWVGRGLPPPPGGLPPPPPPGGFPPPPPPPGGFPPPPGGLPPPPAAAGGGGAASSVRSSGEPGTGSAAGGGGGVVPSSDRSSSE